jgi:tyrosyl-tRNA synthetase
MKLIRAEINSIHLSRSDTIIEALTKAGLASSKSAARELLAGGSIYINNQVVKRDNFEKQDFLGGRLLLRRGKVLKNTALVEII